LAKAVRRIAATGRRIHAAGGAVRTKLRDRSRAAGRRAHDLNAKLRTRSAAAKEEALEVVRRKNAELADLAETAAAEAERVDRGQPLVAAFGLGEQPGQFGVGVDVRDVPGGPGQRGPRQQVGRLAAPAQPAGQLPDRRGQPLHGRRADLPAAGRDDPRGD
jgi:hypothetical protein